MTAEEAKKLSDKLPAKREKIDRAIREAAENGDISISYYADESEHTCKDLKTSLEVDGFSVSLRYRNPESQWDETGTGTFHISW